MEFRAVHHHVPPAAQEHHEQCRAPDSYLATPLDPKMLSDHRNDAVESPDDDLAPHVQSPPLRPHIVEPATLLAALRGASPSTRPDSPITDYKAPNVERPLPQTSKRGVDKAKSSSIKKFREFSDFAKSLPAELAMGNFCFVLTPDGGGGTYYLESADTGHPVAVFKPASQEIGEVDNPRGNTTQDERFANSFTPGQSFLREELAYRLDHGSFSGIPETVIVTLDDALGMGSLQKYVPQMMQSWSTSPGKFDVASIQRIAVFDIRTLNADRHGGNLLVRQDLPSIGMIPIDHGYILPEGWCDPDFEWLLWPQCKLPVKTEVRQYVADLDADADAQMVSEVLGQAAAEVIAVTTRLLQIALAPGKNHTLYDVAVFCRRSTTTEPCGLESLMTSARRDIDDGGELDMNTVETRLQAAFP